MPIIWLLMLLFLVPPGPVVATSEAGLDRGHLEDLEYRVSLGICQDVARVHVRLTQEGPDRYRAEFAAAAQGVWSLLNRWLPERYETEMALEDGRFKPLVIREKFQSRGRQIHKEYRFDYSRGVLEIWRAVEPGPLEKICQTALKEPTYDHLSLFYNLRLGVFGPLVPGQTLRFALLPTPEPRELIWRLGPQDSPGGRRVMAEIKGTKDADEAGPFYLVCSPQGLLQQAWIRVPVLGKLSGQLLNAAGHLEEGLPGLPKSSFQAGETEKRN
jgi:hypothetical protein